MRELAEKYLEIINAEFSGLNLTRITDAEEFYSKQIMDSIIPLQESSVFSESLKKNKLLIDVGFGGGFPLIPLAYSLPDVTALGFEARRKKAEAVQVICQKLGLANVKTHHCRIEQILIDRPATICFKAVGKIADCLSLIQPAKNIEVFFYKGPQLFEKERLDLISSDWEQIEEKMIDLPGTEGRMILGFKLRKVPRGTIPKIKRNKELVKLSDIL